MPNSFLARKRSKEKKLVDHVFPLSGERVQNTPRPMLLLGGIVRKTLDFTCESWAM